MKKSEGRLTTDGHGFTRILQEENRGNGEEEDVAVPRSDNVIEAFNYGSKLPNPQLRLAKRLPQNSRSRHRSSSRRMRGRNWSGAKRRPLSFRCRST